MSVTTKKNHPDGCFGNNQLKKVVVNKNSRKLRLAGACSRKTQNIEEEDMITKFHIKDMTCGHCGQKIRESLRSNSSVENVDIDLIKKLVTVSSTADKGELETMIKKIGYSPELVL